MDARCCGTIRRCAMTDAPRTGPPGKRERRPGQEAATLGKAGKVNSKHNATNSVALSPKIDAMALNQWRCENGLKLYPVLLPHGAQSADGSKWCVGTVEIDLKGQTPGRCRDTSTGARGTGLFDIAEMTGLPWPQTIVRTRRIMAAALAAAAPAKIDAQSPKPSGHDLDHQPNTPAHQRDTRAPSRRRRLGRTASTASRQRHSRATAAMRTGRSGR